MNSEPRIPTLLGLAILTVGLVVGVVATNKVQTFQTQAAPIQIPSNITVINITDTSAAITWQTAAPSSGFVQAGVSSTSQSFKDDRDGNLPQEHTLHFVSLSNLKPSTTYQFKISSNGQNYPQDTTLTFTTVNPTAQTNYSPLIGVVVNKDLTPVSEAYIRLEIPGAQSLATITKNSGNFVLPLVHLKNDSLTAAFSFPEKGVVGKLIITTPTQTSQVILNLPKNQTPLPPITIGQNYDLTSPTQSNQKVLGAHTQNPSLQKIDQYDFNKDGLVNTADAEVIQKNFFKKNGLGDINKDALVDQKDYDLFLHLIESETAQPEQ